MAQNVIINGVTYQAVPEVDIPKSGGGTAKFYDTASADASAADILTGKSAFNSSGSISGSMADNGSTSGTISTKSGTVTIPAGYTSGGTVSIQASALAPGGYGLKKEYEIPAPPELQYLELSSRRDSNRQRTVHKIMNYHAIQL